MVQGGPHHASLPFNLMTTQTGNFSTVEEQVSACLKVTALKDSRCERPDLLLLSLLAIVLPPSQRFRLITGLHQFQQFQP